MMGLGGAIRFALGAPAWFSGGLRFWLGALPSAEGLFWCSVAGGYFFRTLFQLHEQEQRATRLALEKSRLEASLNQAQLEALRARLNPHFLFNSLNAVLSLVRTEPRRAETALEDLADLFRVLMKDNRQLTPLADEVELCRQYLDLEKVRLGDRLKVEWHVENMPRDALVPPLVLQPLLENAVYHGIEPSSGTGVIAVNIFLRRGEVHAILRNPYKLSGGHHGGNKMAMDNIRERLALHFDAEAMLESRINKDSYEVHIRLPYRAAAQEEDAHV
jgi:two-component system sensor histidine kinase AlgZ